MRRLAVAQTGTIAQPKAPHVSGLRYPSGMCTAGPLRGHATPPQLRVIRSSDGGWMTRAREPRRPAWTNRANAVKRKGRRGRRALAATHGVQSSDTMSSTPLVPFVPRLTLEWARADARVGAGEPA